MIFFDLFAVALCIAGAAYAWAFVVSYSNDDWRQYEAGRHLMNFTRGLAVILTWSTAGLVIRALFPDLPWLNQILATGRIVIFGWVVWMLRSRFLLLQEAHTHTDTTDDRTHDHGTTREPL